MLIYCICFNFMVVLFPFLSSPWGSVYHLLYAILSFLLLSYPTLTYPLLSHPILFFPFLFYAILSCPGHLLRQTLSDNLQKLQNRAARVITRSSYDTSASILLNRVNWDNLSTRRKKLKATLMFKIIKGLSQSICWIYLASVVQSTT